MGKVIQTVLIVVISVGVGLYAASSASDMRGVDAGDVYHGGVCSMAGTIGPASAEATGCPYLDEVHANSADSDSVGICPKTGARGESCPYAGTTQETKASCPFSGESAPRPVLSEPQDVGLEDRV